MKRVYLIIALSLILASLPAAGRAEILIDGYFIAEESCAALHSIKNKTNLGDVHLIVDMAYEILSKNKSEVTHYRIVVKGASPKERWVPISCGTFLHLDDDRFDLLHHACAHHTDGTTEADPTVQTCWDADRLDLGRVMITPEPASLCTAPARRPDTIRWALERSRQGHRPAIVQAWRDAC